LLESNPNTDIELHVVESKEVVALGNRYNTSNESIYFYEKIPQKDDFFASSGFCVFERIAA